MIAGTTAKITTAVTNPVTGAPENAAEGTLKLIVWDPAGEEHTYINEEPAREAEAKTGTGLYEYEISVPSNGLWHYRWETGNGGADEGEFEVESADHRVAGEVDLFDLKVILPRARRKVEGPWGNPNGRSPIPDGELYNMIADAVGDTMMLAGSWWQNQILVKSRDALAGFPTAWTTENQLTEWETAVISAQVALNYYYFLFRDMQISQTIKNEGSEWSYTLSANVIRNYLESLRDERDKAIAGLRVNIPVLDRCASNIRVRDQATVAVLEWFDINSPGLSGSGLPGGQEASTIPWFVGSEG